ncbi:uncharacterized protein LOC117320042 [Pecten maximus]|uniref:uncharacterized protein LOC117320042 n=1 Tax=Pecten maximus TaxID=6579 RepID=UPI0014581E39|nr:uncharacterized protein LOC117320042 [Pecten maximus]
MAAAWNFRTRLKVVESKDYITKTTLTDAERARKYRERKKNDDGYKKKERERKKKARDLRTPKQIEEDNAKSKERQKRYRERLKARGMQPKKVDKGSKVLTRKEREKKREYWRIKKQESRNNQSSQKKRRVKEKDRKYRRLRMEKINAKIERKKVSKLQGGNINPDLLNKSSSLLKQIFQDKNVKKQFFHKFSFLKKYGLNRQISKYTGISESYISKRSKCTGDLPRKKRKDAIDTEVQETIQHFCHRPGVSTNLPTAKRVKRDLIERRVLDKPMKTLFKDFQENHPNIKLSLSTFKRNRPKHIETTRKQSWTGCLCELCANVDLKIKALNQLAERNGCGVKIKDKYEAVRLTMCQKPGRYHHYDCIRRDCRECGVDAIVSYFQCLAEKCQDEVLQYTKWERVKKQLKGKEVVRVMPVTKKHSCTQVVIELSSELTPLSEHLFVASWQQDQFSKLQKRVPEGCVLLNMDFSENFMCVSQNEVQTAHWGHEQVTIHPTVAYYQCQKEGCEETVIESLIFITDDKQHDAHAVMAFTKLANQHLQATRGLHIEKQLHMTDGCSAQYKSKTPFTDIYISFSILDFGFPTERHFYGSRHGKGPSDGAGAVVKSFVRRGVLGDSICINNAKEFFNYSKKISKDEEHSKRTFFYVDQINRNRPDRSNSKTIIGTRKLQCVKTVEQKKIATRNLSCFCGGCVVGQYEKCSNSEYVQEWTTQALEATQEMGNGRGVRMRGGERGRPRGGRGLRMRGGERGRPRGGRRLRMRGGDRGRPRGGRGLRMRGGDRGRPRGGRGLRMRGGDRGRSRPRGGRGVQIHGVSRHRDQYEGSSDESSDHDWNTSSSELSSDVEEDQSDDASVMQDQLHTLQHLQELSSIIQEKHLTDENHISSSSEESLEISGMSGIMDFLALEEADDELSVSPIFPYLFDTLTQDQPEVPLTQDQPDVLLTQDQPDVLLTKDQPEVPLTQDQPDVLLTKDEPEVPLTQDQRDVPLTQDQPDVLTKDQPDVLTKDQPEVPLTHDQPDVLTKDQPEVPLTQDQPDVLLTKDQPEVPLTQDQHEVPLAQDQPDVRTKDQPEVPLTHDQPDVLLIQDQPEVPLTQDQSEVPFTQDHHEVLTQDQPEVLTQDQPEVLLTQDQPEVPLTQDQPDVLLTQDQPEVPLTHDQPDVLLTPYQPEVPLTQDQPDIPLTKDQLEVPEQSPGVKAAVENWPLVHFFTEKMGKEKLWVQNTISNSVLPSDVEKTLSAPSLEMVGSRFYYKFEDL